jgi:tetratricopeptide (TPR) repeat protein
VRAEYGDHLEARGLRDSAIAAYRGALAEQPGLAVAWFNLGTTLAGAGRLAESSEAFGEAVHLDPSLGQALSPLLELRVSRGAVVGARALGAPLPSLPVRDRGPGAARLDVAADGAPGVLFANVPPRGVVQVLRGDGTLVRVLPTGDAPTARWDLRAERGAPIAGGLHRVRVLGRDAAGRPLPPQSFSFGVVRRDAPSP